MAQKIENISIDDVLTELKRTLKERELKYPGMIRRHELSIERARVQVNRLRRAIDLFTEKQQANKQRKIF